VKATHVVTIKDADGELEYESDSPDALSALRTVVRAAMKDGWKARNLTSFSVNVEEVHRNTNPRKAWWLP
jgi:hypothetical protein